MYFSSFPFFFCVAHVRTGGMGNEKMPVIAFSVQECVVVVAEMSQIRDLVRRVEVVKRRDN